MPDIVVPENDADWKLRNVFGLIGLLNEKQVRINVDTNQDRIDTPSLAKTLCPPR